MSHTMTMEPPPAAPARRTAETAAASPAEPGRRPGLWSMAVRFTGAAVRHVADGMREVSSEQKAERLSVCGTCPYKSDDRCGVCGCFLSKKAAWRTQDCPLGKWAPVEAGTEAAPAAQPWSPQLRDGLVVTRQESGPSVFYLLKEPDEGAFIRLREAEYFIASQFDGHTGLAAVRRRAEERFEATLPLEVLERFVVKLRAQGLLEADGAAEKMPAGPSRRVRGSLLHLRVKLFDPDRLLAWLAARTGSLFTRAFVALGALLCLAALILTVCHWPAVQSGMARLYRPEMIPIGLATIFGTILMHEMAHGLACRRFGGTVHEIGFLLIYFQPAFYCDVSSAWQLGRKSQRLWVTFAGAFCDLLVWASATLVWRLTQPHAWVNQIALVIMASLGIRSLFNLNPLIQLDGYYLLSDALEIPNLRAKAFQQLRARIGRGPPAERPAAATSPRERRVLLWYGVLALIYSSALLAWLVFNTGAFLMGHFQSIGLGVFVMILAFLGWRMLRRRPAEGNPQGDLPRRRAPRPIHLVGIAALGSATALGTLLEPELRVAGEFEILPPRRAEVRAEVDGFLDAVLAREGDRVCEGQVIARLRNRALQGDLENVEAQIRAQDARLRKLQAGPRAEELTQAESAVATAAGKTEQARRTHEENVRTRAERLVQAQAAVDKTTAQWQAAEERLRRAQGLADRRAISQEELETTREKCSVLEHTRTELLAACRLVQADDLKTSAAAVAVAEAELAESRSRLALLKSGTRAEDLDAARAELNGLLARKRLLEAQCERLEIVSPLTGLVTSRKLADNLGQHVTMGTMILEIEQLDAVAAEIRIPEQEIGDVRMGQSVRLRTRAHPEWMLRGNVTAIGTTAVSRDDEGRPSKMVFVETSIPNPDLRLKPGMTGRSKISCGQRGLWNLATRRLARTLRVEFWSWW